MRDTDDPVRIYQEALREFEEAKKRVRDVVETIRDVASKLKDWPRVKVTNISTPFPPDAALGDASIDAGQWPTGQQIADALVDCHWAYRAMDNAWGALPHERRIGLSEPPCLSLPP